MIGCKDEWMLEQEISTIGLVEACIEDAIARQKAGRVTREECVERMKEALMKNTGSWHAAMDAALDAALASGYVIINRP
jgi:hypothetical protein